MSVKVAKKYTLAELQKQVEDDTGVVATVQPVVPSEDTGPIRAGILAATRDTGEAGPAGPTTHEIAATMVDLMKKGGGGDGPIDIKRFRMSNWLVNFVIAVVVAVSGAFAAYRATEFRSKKNETEVSKNKAAIVEVKSSIDLVGLKVDNTIAGQRELIIGIDQLKKEAQTDKQKRLEDRVRQLQRDNRRLERER